MRVARLFLLVSISFLPSIIAAAQQTATSSPQAVLLLQHSLNPLGGSNAITDVTLTRTARRSSGSHDESDTVVVKAFAGTGSRINLSYASGTAAKSAISPPPRPQPKKAFGVQINHAVHFSRHYAGLIGI